MESWRMLTNGPTSAQTVDGRTHKCTASWWKLTEGVVDALKLTEVYRKSRGWKRHSESWQNFSRLQKIWWKLTECLPAAKKLKGSWRKVSLPHQKFTEVHGRSHCHMESWRKLTESIPATQKDHGRSPGPRMVDGSCRKGSRPNGKLKKVQERSYCRTKFHGRSPGCKEVNGADGRSPEAWEVVESSWTT